MDDPKDFDLNELDASKEPIPPSTQEDTSRFQAEKNKLENDKLKLKLQEQQIKNKNYHQDISLRKIFMFCVLVMFFLWMTFVAFILSKGWLDVGVQHTLLGSTTVEFIGILLIIAKYLFPK